MKDEGSDLYTIKSYVFPQSLEEAYELLTKSPRNNLILGGCCWLKMGSRRIQTAIDLTRLGLDEIRAADGWVEIGANVSLRRLETDPILKRRFGGILGKSVSSIVGVQFRNCATVGGSVFSRFGFSDVTCALLALEATVVLHHAGELPLADFMALPIRCDDILVKVRIPDDGRTAAYESMRRSSTDFPLLAAAVSRRGDAWTVSVGARPAMACRSQAAERALEAGQGAAAAGDAAAAELTFGSNLRGSAAYRQELALVLVRRAAETCMEGGNGQ